MRSTVLAVTTCGMMAIVLNAMEPAARAQAQQGAPAATPAPVDDPVKTLVARLDLEKYKATIKGLTQFGDRRQGTDRNRAAIDWIEAQLKSYGCTNTERIKYQYQPPAGRGGRARGPRRRAEVKDVVEAPRPAADSEAAGAGAPARAAARSSGIAAAPVSTTTRPPNRTSSSES